MQESTNFTAIPDLMKGDGGRKVNLIGIITELNPADHSITVKPTDTTYFGRQ